jgi:CrcB protein
LKAALINVLFVGSGGFIGAIARYGLGGLVQRQMPAATFPYGTLLANMLGCLGIGVVAGLVESRQLFEPQFRAFMLIGVLGGFTTFSTFSNETFQMIRDDQHLRAAVNVGVQVIVGLASVWAGYAVTATR